MLTFTDIYSRGINGNICLLRCSVPCCDWTQQTKKYFWNTFCEAMRADMMSTAPDNEHRIVGEKGGASVSFRGFFSFKNKFPI